MEFNYKRILSDGTVQHRKKYIEIEITDEGNVRVRIIKDVLHNESGPAYITPTGHKYYYIEGKLKHLGITDDPNNEPSIEYANGRKVWYIKTDDKIISLVQSSVIEKNDVSSDLWYSLC